MLSGARDGDVAALQELCDRCTDFIELIRGEIPGPDEARTLFEEAPPGRGPSDKVVIGFFGRTGGLFGVADVIRDYPDPGDWYVGLFLLDPDHRGRGLGQEAFLALERWLRGQGARRLRLVVQEQNPGAVRFWTRMGFERGETALQTMRFRTNTVYRMKKELDRRYA